MIRICVKMSLLFQRFIRINLQTDRHTYMRTYAFYIVGKRSVCSCAVLTSFYIAVKDISIFVIIFWRGGWLVTTTTHCNTAVIISEFFCSVRLRTSLSKKVWTRNMVMYVTIITSFDLLLATLGVFILQGLSFLLWVCLQPREWLTQWCRYFRTTGLLPLTGVVCEPLRTTNVGRYELKHLLTY